MDKQEKAEKSIRAEYEKLRHAYDGWPKTNADWAFFSARIRAIDKYLNEREQECQHGYTSCPSCDGASFEELQQQYPDGVTTSPDA